MGSYYSRESFDELEKAGLGLPIVWGNLQQFASSSNNSAMSTQDHSTQIPTQRTTF